MGISIHKGMVVAGLINYYDRLLYDYQEDMTVRQRLRIIAERLWKAYQYDNRVVLNQINNYNPKYISKSWIDIKSEGFYEQDAYDTIACEYGYKSWDEVPTTPIDIAFAKAIDIMLAGDVDTLKQMLAIDPSLVVRRSHYAHRATLLHYLGSNGVELYRQVVPSNLAEVITILLAHGADHKATMPVYGGNFTMIDLLKTSAHPKAAGLLSSVVKTYEQITSKL